MSNTGKKPRQRVTTRTAVTPTKQHPVTTVTPNPLAWKTAKKLASGDTGRIQVVSQQTLIVHNNGNWRAKRPQ